MTAEHRLFFTLGDLRALTFECQHEGCGVRVSVTPDGFDPARLEQCPACRAPWLSVEGRLAASCKARPNAELPRVLTPTAALMLATTALRETPNARVRLLLEFDEPAR